MMGDSTVIAPDRESFVQEATSRIAGIIGSSIRAAGRCSIMLAGGSTPRAVYERLSAGGSSEPVDWQRVEFYFGDERCVPPDDPLSNYRMAQEALFSRLPVGPERVHRIEAELPDREQASLRYEAILPERLDLILLGMGADGHTASLFPRAPALAERVRRIVPVLSQAAPPWRISITPPVIAGALRIVMLVTGEEKAMAVATALEGAYEPQVCPAQLARQGLWILDTAAAQVLTRR